MAFKAILPQPLFWNGIFFFVISTMVHIYFSPAIIVEIRNKKIAGIA